MLQRACSLLLPKHSLPPLEGAGLVHVLIRYFVPNPHVTSQLPYAPQRVHEPSTMLEKNSDSLQLIF